MGVQGYKPPDEGPSEYQTIPLSKIEDFGVHCRQYYSLDVNFFKSSLDAQMLDLLWNKYWVNTLSASPLLGTRDLAADQTSDIGACPALPCRTSSVAKFTCLTVSNACALQAFTRMLAIRERLTALSALEG